MLITMTKQNLIDEMKAMFRDTISIVQTGYMNGNADIDGRDEYLEMIADYILKRFDEKPNQDTCEHPSHSRVIDQDKHEYCSICNLHFE